MSDILFSTNPSDWVASEGLYVNQQKQEGSVTGANVSIPGLFDVTVRGPLTPQVVASDSDFTALYGGRDAGGGGAIVNKIWKAKLNRKFPYPMVVCRVAASAAVAAHANAPNATPTDIVTVTATSVGTWANNASGTGVSFAITAASDGDSDRFNLVVKYGGQVTTYKNLDVSATGIDNTSTVIGTSIYNLVTVTKLANGRPSNTSSDINLASGTDGTVAAADYEAAFDKIAAHPLVRIVPVGCDLMVDASGQAAVNTYVAGKVANYPLTMFLMWSGAGKTRADEITAKAAQLTTPADNIWWCYNPSSTQDSSQTLIETGSHLDMAVILSNTDVAVHPGAEDNIPLLSGIKSVYNDGITRADLVLLRAAGICTLVHVANGFQFHSCVSSNSTGSIGDETSVEAVDVRRRAWLTESLARSWRHDVKRPATDTVSRSMIAKGTAFLRDDQRAEHVVASDDTTLGPGFKLAFVETPAERARNIRKLMTKIRMISYNLTIVMVTDIGTGVTIVKTE